MNNFYFLILTIYKIDDIIQEIYFSRRVYEMKRKTMFFILFLALFVCACLIFCTFHFSYQIADAIGKSYHLDEDGYFLSLYYVSVGCMIAGFLGMVITALIPNKPPKFLKRKEDESEQNKA